MLDLAVVVAPIAPRAFTGCFLRRWTMRVPEDARRFTVGNDTAEILKLDCAGRRVNAWGQPLGCSKEAEKAKRDTAWTPAETMEMASAATHRRGLIELLDGTFREEIDAEVTARIMKDARPANSNHRPEAVPTNAEWIAWRKMLAHIRHCIKIGSKKTGRRWDAAATVAEVAQACRTTPGEVVSLIRRAATWSRWISGQNLLKSGQCMKTANDRKWTV